MQKIILKIGGSVITKKDDSLEQHNAICFVRNNQQIKAILPETGI